MRQPTSPRPPSLRRWREVAYDFLFPLRCAVCAANGDLLCDVCWADFVPVAPPRCLRCWAPANSTAADATACEGCRADPPVLRALRAAFTFEGAARRALLAVKYQGLTATVPPIIDLAMQAPAMGGLATDLELVAAIPMAGARGRRRGHNQAARFGRELAAPPALPFDEHAPARRRATPKQARQPSLAARRDNVRDAFVADLARVSGRCVLVVDDVTTSGATLNACAEALLAAGAVAVDGWTVVRED